MNVELNFKPKDHNEAIAVFRAQVLGPVLCMDVGRRELARALRELASKRFSPPGSKVTRTYAASTLQRWYYSYRAHGLAGLHPATRKTGHAQQLSDEQRALILAIRETHPNASVPLILRTLQSEGRIAEGVVSAPAVRRLLATHSLDRRTLARSGKRERRRWEAERPGKLWHADVCHGPSLLVGDRKVPLRIHGMLDDASRFIPVIAARSSEREADMLELLLQALREHGKPDGIYVDNGATYRGEALALVCSRLGIALVHAQPYDAPARGKMERFWRTLREGCLDFLGELTTLHEVQLRLVAFLDAHYHRAAHAGLMGRSPASVWATRRLEPIPEAELVDALTLREQRQVHQDGTLSIGGMIWEAEQGWLAGRVVTIARTLADVRIAPWIEHENRRLILAPVDPKANARRRRVPHRAKRGIDAVDFDPNHSRVQRVLGRKSGGAR
ncbi:MAG TPA: DDE-type integrase/transposase/recombinase [Nannocystaceae bacterium]|nr:DDE-type integrase/transposase/recombinase [Nannocystaceae bacterium]